ncbi:hypothetical protein LTR99_006450 [Exophiala xenobiotica]|uniref:Peroxisomal adenine nucleotide transporter 1 n=1 Tax=Vermiconidia calcicola TaxID=1690605 RepID=A0AAV9QAN6_9PEZI|nr:hypothetical protein LTR96_007296 [Exophiala xenobiotica]KAK5536939.1 hypothetical protein LTR23_007787 [Chaetothyriales sp. CCFEE 6169]KAK5537620.1 hypothetical protein LTR25_004872 [Vermiconidia calcicola]KAK5301483.1 hypothetical protein LTR99_006450 [Exophiala xenobiotica]KAK5335002.1 hypothetical protein LTR98_008722 [Exophiala xenobiotica]
MSEYPYNSQLDAFELYHKVKEESQRPRPSSSNTALLEALGHAISGSIGSSISNAALYPIDLIITRLQIQRQLRGKDQSHPSDTEYKSFTDAVQKIYNNEGGIAGLFTGLAQDTAKTIADSFIFFLLYTYFRNRRLVRHANAHSLPALEELSVGFLAGSLTKLATTPIANVVTRKQAAALLASKDPDTNRNQQGGGFKVPNTHQIIQDILSERGLLGFWSGYSASLVLTLNPSLTFFLFETLKKALLPRHKRAQPPASLTFLLSAISKATASSITYPFSLAKARLQAGGAAAKSSLSTSPDDADADADADAETERKVVDDDIPSKQGRAAARATIFSTVRAIAQTEGLTSLYEGLHLEIVRAFFSHGLTMLVKQAIQRFLVRAYYITSIIVGRYQRRTKSHGAKNKNRLSAKARASVEYYNLAMARAGEKIDEAANAVSQKANETAEFVAEYVEEEGGQWRDLYGTAGLARWLDKDRHL